MKWANQLRQKLHLASVFDVEKRVTNSQADNGDRYGSDLQYTWWPDTYVTCLCLWNLFSTSLAGISMNSHWSFIVEIRQVYIQEYLLCLIGAMVVGFQCNCSLNMLKLVCTTVQTEGNQTDGSVQLNQNNFNKHSS